MSASRNLRVLTMLVVLFSLLVPLVRPAMAQDGGINDGLECPEGLVPDDEVVDLCVLPEGEDDTTDDAVTDDVVTDDVDDTTGDTADDTADTIDDVTDGGEDALDEAPTLDDPDGADDNFFEVDPNEPSIQNITFVSYSCPVNWNPANREPTDSHDVCRIAPAAGVAYEIAFEGRTVVEVAEQQDVDLSRTGIPMRAGRWSITALPLEGKGVSVAFCVIYDANDGQRSLFLEPVPEGYMNFTLAEGEELNCEWFSTTVAPDVAPDDGNLPILNFRLFVYSCALGVDVVNSPTTTAIQACTSDRAPFFPMSFWVDDVQQYQVDVRAPGSVDLAAALDRRPRSGRWQVDQPIMEGYAEPVVRCTIRLLDGTTSDAAIAVGTVAYHSMAINVAPDQEAICFWFNMESQPRAAQSLGFSMTVRQCPDTWNRDDQGGEDQMEAACTAPIAAPMTFSYRLEDGPEFTATTNMEGTVTFFENAGAPSAGKWFVTAALPPGTGGSVVLCKGVNSAGQGTISARDGLISNVVEIDLAADEQLTCTWYLAPIVQQSLSIGRAWTCPAGVDPAALPQLERIASCEPDPTLRVVIAPNFNGNLADVVASGLAMVPNPDGVATFPLIDGAVTMLTLIGDPANLQPGNVTAVSCDHTLATSGQVMTIEPAVTDGMITMSVAEGDRLECDLFAETIEDPEAFANGSSLTIARRDCRDTVQPEDSYEDHLMNCDGSAAGDTYAFPDGGQVTAVNGFAEWKSIVLQDTMITNTTTQQTGEIGIVYCSSLGGEEDTFPELVTTSGATITLSYPGGSQVYCDWFVHPRNDE